jgi:hypothetical protein
VVCGRELPDQSVASMAPGRECAASRVVVPDRERPGEACGRPVDVPQLERRGEPAPAYPEWHGGCTRGLAVSGSRHRHPWMRWAWTPHTLACTGCQQAGGLGSRCLRQFLLHPLRLLQAWWARCRWVGRPAAPSIIRASVQQHGPQLRRHVLMPNREKSQSRSRTPRRALECAAVT